MNPVIGIAGSTDLANYLANTASEHGADASCTAIESDSVTFSAQFADSDVLFLAIDEPLESLTAVLGSLDAACASASLIVVCTDLYSITALAAATTHPERVVGMSWATPVRQLTLVEVVPGLRTSQAALEVAEELLTNWNKTAIVVRNRPGLIARRVTLPLYDEAIRLVDGGDVRPQDLDALMVGLGFEHGPLEMLDESGLDHHLRFQRRVFEQLSFDRRYHPNPLLQELVDAGQVGRSAGRGFYDH